MPVSRDVDARRVTASSEAALDQFGSRGFEAVSLDDIASDVGVAKQTVLYWFPSKDHLLGAVLQHTADELGVAVEAAVRAAPDDPLERVEAVVKAAFRPAVRRPALLGLVREVSRLDPQQSELLLGRVRPMVEDAVAYLGREMAAGRLRSGNPRLVLSLAYATVAGIATEPEALRAVGWEPSVAGIRRLRSELLAFLRAALAPTRLVAASRRARSGSTTAPSPFPHIRPGGLPRGRSPRRRLDPSPRRLRSAPGRAGRRRGPRPGGGARPPVRPGRSASGGRLGRRPAAPRPEGPEGPDLRHPAVARPHGRHAAATGRPDGVAVARALRERGRQGPRRPLHGRADPALPSRRPGLVPRPRGRGRGRPGDARLPRRPGVDRAGTRTRTSPAS